MKFKNTHIDDFEMKAGYSLIEVVMATAIASLLAVGVLSFYKDTTRLLYDSEKTAYINSEIRAFIEEITVTATKSHEFILYEAYNEDVRNVSDDVGSDDPLYYDTSEWSYQFISDWALEQQPEALDVITFRSNNPFAKYRKRDGQSGDLLVFVTYNNTNSSEYKVNRNRGIKKITGYFRVVEDPLTQLGSIRKFVVVPTGDQQKLPVEMLLPTPPALPPSINGSDRYFEYKKSDAYVTWDRRVDQDFREVVGASRGLANKRIFYNNNNQNIIVFGQLVYGNDHRSSSGSFQIAVAPNG